MRKTQGLFFKKFDLHVHTPASEDYKDKNVTAQKKRTGDGSLFLF